jgi:hypothetical protein
VGRREFDVRFLLALTLSCSLLALQDNIAHNLEMTKPRLFLVGVCKVLVVFNFR